MASGNIFLGTGRRSVGDVTLYRRNGTQVSRLRVRKVANPKTNPQSLQRNYFSPVSRFFSPLSGVLERSWEGYNRSESYSKFLQHNIKLARQSGWYIPKGAGWIPMPYRLSQGSLPSVDYSMIQEALVLNDAGFPAITQNTWGAVSRRLIEMGYQEGDQVTVIGVVNSYGGETGTYFATYFREFINPQSVEVLENIGNAIISFALVNGKIQIMENNDQLLGGAIIISRFVDGKWLRSTQNMVVDNGFLYNYTSSAARQAAIDSYGNTSGLIDSDVYLNGSTVAGSRSGGRRSPLRNLVVPVVNADGEILLEGKPYGIWFDENKVIPAMLQMKNVADGSDAYAPILLESTPPVGREDTWLLGPDASSSAPQSWSTSAWVDAQDKDSLIGQWLLDNGVDENVWP